MAALTKSEMRAHCLSYRDSLTQDIYQQKSGLITERVKGLEIVKQANIIHCYISINSRNEVDTLPLLSWLLDQGKRVAAPRSDFETLEMEHIQLSSLDDLEITPYGILEPAKGEPILPDAFDLILVPMVGGDRNCQRIGYGKGFYDRFLKETKGIKAGLVYESCVMDQSIPTNRYDVPLDLLITEQGIQQCATH